MIEIIDKTLTIVLSKDFIVTSFNEENGNLLKRLSTPNIIGHSLFAITSELNALAHPIWNVVHHFLMARNDEKNIVQHYQLDYQEIAIRFISILHGYILIVEVKEKTLAHFFPNTLAEQLFFDNVEPLALIDIYGTFLKANTAWCKLFNISLDRLQHDTKIKDLCPEFVYPFAEKIMAQKKYEIETNTYQGYPLCLTLSHYHEANVSVYCIKAQSILDQHVISPVLMQYYAQFFHLPNVMQFLVDSDSKQICDVTEAACLFYQKTSDELKQNTVDAILTLSDYHWNTVSTEFLEGTSDIDNITYTLSVYIHPIIVEQKSYLLLHIHNISTYKTQLQQFRALSDDIHFVRQKLPMGIWELDLATNRMIWDDNLYLLYGLNPLDDTYVQPHFNTWMKFIHPQDLIRVEEKLAHAIKTCTDFEETFQIILHDKSIRVVRVFARFIQQQEIKRYTHLRGIILDISTEYFAKKALEESELLCYETCNHAPVGILRLNTNGKIIQVNQAVIQLLGFSYDMLAQRDWEELIYPADRALNQQQYTDLITQQTMHYHSEIRFIQYSGEVIWVNLAVSPYYTSENILKFTIAMLQDITVQKTVQMALYESQNQLTRIMEGSNDGFWDWDISTGVFTFNHYWSEMLGYSQEEIQPHIDMWFDLIHPDDVQSVREQLIKNIAGECTSYAIECRVRTKSGEWIWVCDRGKVTAHSAKGTPLLVSGTRTNIHARKQIESKLEEERQLFIAGPIVAFKWKPQLDWIVDYVSPNIQVQWGYSVQDVMQPTFNFASLIHPDDLQRITDEVEYYSHHTNKVYLEQEYRIRYADGSYHWQYDFTSILRYPDNQVYLYYGYLLDIESRKQNEKELFLVNEQLLKTLSELKKHDYEMTLLYHMTESLQSCETEEKAYHVIASFCARLFPELNGRVAVYNKVNRLEDVATWGENCCCAAYFNQDCELLMPQHQNRQTHTQIVHFDMPIKYSSLLQCDHVKHAPQLQSFCMPMIMNGKSLGIFHLNAQKTNQVLENPTRQLATAVTEAIKLSLANIQLRHQLHEQAIRDALTGLFNRRYLDDILPVQLNAARRFQQTLGLVLLDADFFKRFNDHYGHEAGDIVLQKIAEVLHEETAPQDITCRYGGEEMVLIISNMTLEKIVAHVEKIRQRIKAVSILFHQQVLPRITVSAGIAFFPDHAETPDSLLRAADTALYEAKNTGRDRACVFNPAKNNI